MVKQFLEFLRALVLAGYRTCLASPGTHCLTSPFRIMRSLMTRSGGSPLSGLRMDACRQCPLYDDTLKTCGNAINPLILDSEPAGCFCYMPLKVTLPDATCWLNERTDNNSGWSETARGV